MNIIALRALVPVVAALPAPAWVGMEKEARLGCAISASEQDSAASAMHLALPSP